MTDIDYSEWSKPRPHVDEGSRDPLIVRFREGTVLNERLSAAGPGVYDRLFEISVMAPGQKSGFPIYELERHIGDKVKQSREYARFKRAFEDWKQGLEPTIQGTPLSDWPLMRSRAIVRAFADANIYSVEQLAAMSDAAHDAVSTASRAWQEKAKAWLSDKAGGAHIEQAEKVAQLEALVAQQARSIEALLQAQNAPEMARPPSRRRKQPDDDGPTAADIAFALDSAGDDSL